MKRTLAITTLLLTGSFAIPARAVQFNSSPVANSNAVEIAQYPSPMLLAQQETFEEYRNRRHAELEQQMRQQMNQPAYQTVPVSEKARIIRDAHNALDQQLDREYAEWQRGQSSYGTYGNNGYNRSDRYNSNSGRTSTNETFDEYRNRRHGELEQQMRQQMNQPQYNNLSAQEKARIIREAHQSLDQRLDQEYQSGRYTQDRMSDRYNRNQGTTSDRYDRYDRYNNNSGSDRYDRYNR